MAKWQKGQSGNPGGRPKVIGHLRDLARSHTEEAIETLVEVMRDQDAPPAARVSAAEAILSRGWDKPHASLDVSGGVAVYSIADAIRAATARREIEDGVSDTEQFLALPSH